jgi:citrate synthase
MFKKPEYTGICLATRDAVSVRGKDLCDDIIGHMSASSFLYFHVTGETPTREQVLMLDALIVAMAEHGMTPSALASRMTYSGAPEALQGAVAAGILGAGTVLLGASGAAATMLSAAVEKIRAGAPAAGVAEEVVNGYREGGGRMPGFGHPVHKPEDPRAVRLLELAQELGVYGDHCAFLPVLQEAADRLSGKHVVANIQLATAAIACDIGMPPFLVKIIPIVARAIGVLGHIAEEAQNPVGFYLSLTATETIPYRP